MRVGIDSHSAEREGEGNATYCRNLISALLEVAGTDDLVLFAADPAHPFYQSLPRRDRVRVVRVRQGRGILRLACMLARAAARARVDCLHAQYLAPLRYRGPIVLSVHDLGFLHLPESFPLSLRTVLRVLVPRALARASRIIVPSAFTRDDIVARCAIDPGRVIVIPLAASPRFRPLEADTTARVLARYALRPGFLFSLGRLNQRKNLDRLLLAYARLRQAGTTSAPLVVGGKPDHGVEDVLRRARLCGEDAGVRFVGLIPDADLPAFYGAARCFVYPSLLEGFGLPVLEAMACGTPVVAANRTALPELVGDAGILADPESVDDLAAAIGRVMDDAVFARALGARGLERSRGYSWAETARRTLGVYRDATLH